MGWVRCLRNRLGNDLSRGPEQRAGRRGGQGLAGQGSEQGSEQGSGKGPEQGSAKRPELGMDRRPIGISYRPNERQSWLLGWPFDTTGEGYTEVIVHCHQKF